MKAGDLVNMDDLVIIWFYCGPAGATEERIASGFPCCPRCGKDVHEAMDVWWWAPGVADS